MENVVAVTKKIAIVPEDQTHVWMVSANVAMKNHAVETQIRA